MRRSMCNKDCFNCPYSDCILEEDTAESDIIEGTPFLAGYPDRPIVYGTSYTERQKRYNSSDKGKERYKRYSTSDKGKDALKRYNQTEKGKERFRRYYQAHREEILAKQRKEK